MDNDLKELIIIGGPNGSGKTTFAKAFLIRHPMNYLNADEIAKEISIDYDKNKLAAGKEFFNRLSIYKEKKQSLLIESTLAGAYLARLIESFRKSAFTVTIVFIFLETPEVCVERIKERVKKGGHHVPDEDVKRRYYRSIRNFWNSYKAKQPIGF